MLSMTNEVIARDLPGLYGADLGITAVYPTHAWTGGEFGLVAPEMLRPLGGLGALTVTPSVDSGLRTTVAIAGSAIGAAIGSSIGTDKWGRAGGILTGIAAGAGIGLLGLVIYNQIVAVGP